MVDAVQMSQLGVINVMKVSRPEGDTYNADRTFLKPENCYASAMTLIRCNFQVHGSGTGPIKQRI